MNRPSAIALLPSHIGSQSISAREIVLPEKAALAAIDILEEQGVLILGWEGWVKAADGRVGHGSAPQGTESLQDLTVAQAAALYRQSIPEAADEWRQGNAETTDQLHFCITVRRPTQ